ncbi:response regulator transcription factor [bacterium]|nr:MAG: response regulator transcription factor [bacterium]
MTAKIFTCLIVDDEPLARKRISSLLEQDSSVTVIGVCANGLEALKVIETQTPDILFVDIQMPEMSGFQLIETVGPNKIPATIFVTAYDEFALKAFEVHAMDYVLKPFENERFFNTLERAKQIIINQKTDDLQEKVVRILEDLNAKKNYVKRIMVKNSDKVFFIEANEIDYLESSGNYVKIHSLGKHQLVRDTLTNMLSNLDPEQFFRVHRSTVVNIDKVKELQPWFHGDYLVVMKDGTKLNMSRNYKEILDHK